MTRTSPFRSYPLATKSFSSAASNSGFDGGLVSRMSSSGSISPRWKKCFQYRLTSALAKNGLAGARIQSASRSRGSSSGAIAGTASPSAAGRSAAFVRMFVAVATPRLW